MAETKIKTTRKSLGIKQSTIAKILGVTQSTYSYWENGRTPIPEKYLQQIADILNVDIEEIYQDDFPTKDGAPPLTAFQKGLIELFDELDETRKAQALEFAIFLLSKQKRV